MEALSIKVMIANRVYPLTVDASEEAQVREAAQLVTEKVKLYEKSFAVKDKQDLLAMAALDYATTTLKNEAKSEDVGSSVQQRLSELDNLVAKEIQI